MVKKTGFRCQVSGVRLMLSGLVLLLAPGTWSRLAGAPALAQQPQAQQGQPLYAVNAKYVNGVAPGYWPTAGSGLTLNLSAGTVMCQSVATNYAGGTLSMTASQTNYVFLNPAMSCAPFATTSSFTPGEIPIAIVVAGASTITSVTDVRTWFSTSAVSLPASYPAIGTNSSSQPVMATGVDVDPLRVSVKDCGAYGDGIHDDTAAIQSCLNKFTNGLTSIANGSLYFPAGSYNISAPLYFMEAATGVFRMLGVGSGYSSGSSIYCVSSGCAMAMFITMGMNNQSGIEKISFFGGNYATKGIWYSSTNGVGGTFTQAITPGTHTVTVGSLNQSQGNIVVGSLLNVDQNPNTEFIVVSGVTGTPPNITAITATFTKAHAINTPFGNSDSAGSGATFRDVSIFGITGSPSYGIAFGSTFGNEAASVTLENVTVSGAGPSGPPTYGVAALSGANTEAFYIYNGSTIGVATGYYFFANGQVTLLDTQLGNNGLDLFLEYDNAQVINVHSEGSKMFLVGGGVLENCSWVGTAAATGTLTDVVINQVQNPLVIINSFFWNQRTNSSLPLILTEDYDFNPAGGRSSSFTSIASSYFNATGYVPIYTASGARPDIPTDGTYNVPQAVTSINDMGPTVSGGVRLQNYFSTGILTDSSCAASSYWTQVATSGLIRTCNGGTPIAFRNYAGTADIPGMTTNSSDQVVLGGTPGVSASQYSTTVATGTPPLSVTSTTPVANLTVQNCDTCNITTSMTVGGGTALHAMNLYDTASITPTAVTASSCSDQTFVVSGLLATDRVSSIAPPSVLGNLSLDGYASAANTALFHFCNPSSSSVTPPAGVYSFLAVH